MRVFRCDRCFDLHDTFGYTVAFTDPDGNHITGGLQEICTKCYLELVDVIRVSITARFAANGH